MISISSEPFKHLGHLPDEKMNIHVGDIRRVSAARKCAQVVHVWNPSPAAEKTGWHPTTKAKEPYLVNPNLPAALHAMLRALLGSMLGRSHRRWSIIGLAFLFGASLVGPAQAETRRLCDRRVTFEVVPPSNVPAELASLSGIWRGTVIMAGGSEMCLSMVVKEVFPDGTVHLLMTWNLSMGGRDDINNYVGMGEALHWPNKVENGEIRIDSRTRYNGTHYYYVLRVPTEDAPHVIEGRWMTDSHPQPVVLHRVRR